MTTVTDLSGEGSVSGHGETGAPSLGKHMTASIHVIPAAGMRAEADNGSKGGSGIATVALRTAERVGTDVDLVLVAVAPGEGERLAAYLGGQGFRWLTPRSRGAR